MIEGSVHGGEAPSASDPGPPVGQDPRGGERSRYTPTADLRCLRTMTVRPVAVLSLGTRSSAASSVPGGTHAWHQRDRIRAVSLRLEHCSLLAHQIAMPRL